MGGFVNFPLGYKIRSEHINSTGQVEACICLFMSIHWGPVHFCSVSAALVSFEVEINAREILDFMCLT